MSKLDHALTAYAASPTAANKAAIVAAVAPGIADLKACLAQREQSLIDAKKRELAGDAAPVASVPATMGDNYAGRNYAQGWNECRRSMLTAAHTPPATDVSAPTDEREVFVAYWRARYQYGPTHAFLDEFGNFCTPKDDPVHIGWDTWQAARAAAPVSGPTEVERLTMELQNQREITQQWKAKANYGAAPVSGQPPAAAPDELPISRSTYGTKESCEAEHLRRARAAAPAPIQSAPSNEELEEVWEMHAGHPADFAADVLERWGGWPMGVMGYGGSRNAKPIQSADVYRDALIRIARPYDCGCSYPCRCDSPEAEKITSDGLRDIAIIALAAPAAAPAQASSEAAIKRQVADAVAFRRGWNAHRAQPEQASAHIEALRHYARIEESEGFFGSVAHRALATAKEQASGDVIREAIEAAFEERAGWRTKISAAVRALAKPEQAKPTDLQAAGDYSDADRTTLAFMGIGTPEAKPTDLQRRGLAELATRIEQAGGGPLHIDHTAGSAIRSVLAAQEAKTEALELTNIDVANICVRIRPDDYMLEAVGVDYLRYDGDIVRAVLRHITSSKG